MIRSGYFIRRALRGMGASKLIQLAAVGAIGTGLLLVGLAATAVFNVDRVTAGWGRGTHLTVYLKPDTPVPRAAGLVRLLHGRPEVAGVTRVTAEEARRRLVASLGGRASLLDEIEPDFLPASLEVRLAEGVQAERVRPLIALLGAARHVDEVEYMGQWSDRLGTTLALVRRAALLVALIIALACIYIVATTIRLGVFARREEIEIQKLVGATDGFIRAPMLIEGALQGTAGALVAIGLLYGLYRWIAPGLQQALASLMSNVELAFLPAPQLLLGIAAGALLGLLGSSLALSRYVRP